MEAAKKIDQEITQYLVHLNNRQKEAVLAVVKTFAEESGKALYDEDFKKELDSRYEEFQNGGQLISEDEANGRIQAILKGGKAQ